MKSYRPARGLNNYSTLARICARCYARRWILCSVPKRPDPPAGFSDIWAGPAAVSPVALSAGSGRAGLPSYMLQAYAANFRYLRPPTDPARPGLLWRRLSSTSFSQPGRLGTLILCSILLSALYSMLRGVLDSVLPSALDSKP